jgi:hypothetical protein
MSDTDQIKNEEKSVAITGYARNACSILVGKSDVKEIVDRPTLIRENTIKIDLPCNGAWTELT